MFGIGRDQDVAADVDAGARAFLEGDHGQAIEKMVQDLLAFDSRFLGDAVLNLRGGRENTAVVADLGEAAKAADHGGGGERLKISVADFGGKARSPNLIETDVLVEVDREPVRTDGAMKGDEQLALLCVADALYSPNQPSTLPTTGATITSASSGIRASVTTNSIFSRSRRSNASTKSLRGFGTGTCAPRAITRRFCAAAAGKLRQSHGRALGNRPPLPSRSTTKIGDSS